MKVENKYKQKMKFRDKTIKLHEFTQSSDFHYLSYDKQVVMAHNLNMRIIILNLL